ncbi:MAG: hypothetical protein NUV63_12640 [Gallionella sp.]|nr:hypothetical protein [Gallionella sp.]
MLSSDRKSIRLLRHSSSLLAGIALLFPLQLLGADQSDEQLSQPDRIETIDAPRDYLSGKFVGFVSGIDRFFGDERNYQESNKSVLQLDLTRVTGYGGDRKIVLSGRARVNLPSTEKRLHLMVETNPDKNISGEPTQAQTTPLRDVAAPESYSAALRYEKSEESRWHFSTDAGVQFRGVTSNLFARARGSYSIQLDQWRLKAAETVFWFHTIGAGESTQLDVERFLSEPLLFRATSNATWLHDKQNFDLRQDLSVYHTLNDRSALLYQTSAIGVSEPHFQATDYVILMVYRYRLHRDWIFFELSPQQHFPREKNYHPSPMLVMRLEMLFDESK